MRYIDDVEIKKPSITIGTHFFSIKNPNEKINKVIINFNKNYTLIAPAVKRDKAGRVVYEVKARFYSTLIYNNEYRYHIEQLDSFLTCLEEVSVTPEDVDIIEKFYTDAPSIDIKAKEGWILRDYQEEVKKFLLDTSTSVSRSRLASLPTGTGKTVIALMSAVTLGKRIGIPVPAGYADKWKSDVLEQLDISEDDVYMVNSRSKLVKAISLAKEDTLCKVYIFNQETLASFYKEFESSEENSFKEMYGCHPEDIFETLKIGVTIIDETHEAINMVFKLFCYSNVPLNIGLSGTLRSRDPFFQKIQKLMYPMEIRYDKVKMAKYIEFMPTIYTYYNMDKLKLRTSFNGSMYSQAAYEQSIMKNKNKNVLKNFLKMIDHYFKEDYLDRKKEGERCAIYASRIEMCSLIVNYLKSKYPSLDIRKYTAEDPFENAVDADIRVTTRGSCGTAIDIKKLVSLITVDNVDSDVGNLQLLGRLRENKETDTVPRFRQLYCDKIPKHRQYQKNRHQIFSDRIVSCNYSRYGQPLDIPEGESFIDYRG